MLAVELGQAQRRGVKIRHSYALTLLLVALCAFVQYKARYHIGQRAPLGLLYIPVMASAIFAGWRQSVLASVLGLLLSPLLVAPAFSLRIERAEDAGALMVMAAVCLFTCIMAWILERAENKAQAFLLSLESREQTLRALLGASSHAVIGIGSDGRIGIASESVSTLFHYEPEEIIGQSFEVLVVNGLRQLRGEGLNNLFHANAPGPVGELQELQCRRKDGSVFPAEASLAMADVPTGRLVISYIADISERREAERKILHAARHDPLTGLPNRALVYELGTHLLAAARRHRDRIAILFFDLDRFKPINDTYGHAIGDGMLQQVANRLKSGLRANDLVGRLGGDEFVAILCDVHEDDAVLHMASQLLQTLSEPYRIGTLELKTSPSIGISLYPDDGEDLDALIQHADAAMYHAKNAGRNRCQFFTHEIYLHAKQTFDLEQRLRHSIADSDFEVVYQPFIDLRSRKFIGVEALLRWRSAGASPVAQDRFIAAAERIGLINVLGDWVLQQACMQHEKWRNLGLPPLRMAVNVSAVQFREKTFSERAARIIRQSGINPACIELEVTESAVMSDVEEAAKMLERLKQDGISIALDDFGTGYSSLSYLSQFPINKLKIDKSFILNIDTDARSLAIAETVIALGKKLGMTVIAEGIESQSGIKLLADIGCDLGQGYFISKPVRPEHIVEWYYQAQYQHLFV
ncbi:putative bifunctional diguanylate cyclase/phosphodiesterase [Massilia consociata]|uniref:Bifunctional diguanylate cyclase/phosphodiesterase n=1 Tax=Massilia consociata TaxID=760117 RepID=A0ABV6FHR6_9BURK